MVWMHSGGGRWMVYVPGRSEDDSPVDLSAVLLELRRLVEKWKREDALLR